MTGYSTYTDIILLDLMKAEDHRAFDELYDRHWKALYQTAYAILRDENACMDILQDIFVWLWEHRGHLVLTTVRGYLTMAVKYKASNYIRRLNRQRLFTGEMALHSKHEYVSVQDMERSVDMLVHLVSIWEEYA